MSRRRSVVRLDAAAGGRSAHETLGARGCGDSDELTVDEADERAALESRVMKAILGLSWLTEQQHTILCAKYAIASAGGDPNHHATARFLGWAGESGHVKVSTQWNRMARRLRAEHEAGNIPELAELYPRSAA